MSKIISEEQIRKLFIGQRLNLLMPECIDTKDKAPILECFIAEAQRQASDKEWIEDIKLSLMMLKV